jgi:hypothetical protein
MPGSVSAGFFAAAAAALPTQIPETRQKKAHLFLKAAGSGFRVAAEERILPASPWFSRSS